tara:strand:+ start:10992 stop:12482 length:1491 start_codon:yes stop_codon:yes gene_type:complete
MKGSQGRALSRKSFLSKSESRQGSIAFVKKGGDTFLGYRASDNWYYTRLSKNVKSVTSRDIESKNINSTVDKLNIEPSGITAEQKSMKRDFNYDRGSLFTIGRNSDSLTNTEGFLKYSSNNTIIKDTNTENSGIRTSASVARINSVYYESISSPITITAASSLSLGTPIAGDGVTITNPYSLELEGNIKSNGLVIDDSGDITLDASGADINFTVDGYSTLNFNRSTGLTIYNLLETSSYFNIQMSLLSGQTTFSTVDHDGSAGHLNLVPNGDLKLRPTTGLVKMDATDKLYFDGGGDTYIHESGTDVMAFQVGDIEMLKLDEENSLIDVKADNIRVLSESGGTYAGPDTTSLQTKAQIDAARVIYKTEVSLSQAECTALHSTEITLVAGQGSNMVIIPTSVTCYVDRAVTQTVSGADAFVGWNGASTIGTTCFFLRRFMWNEGGDRILHLVQLQQSATGLTAGDNRPLTIKLDSAITTDAFTSMKVITTYYVYDNS